MLSNRVKALLLGVVLALGSSSVFAVLTIEICGTATPTSDGSCSGPSSLLSDTWSGTLTGMAIGSAHDSVRICDTAVSGVCIDYPLAPSKAWPTPTGWTAPSSPEVNPAPPSTASSVGEYCANDGSAQGCGATMSDAAVALQVVERETYPDATVTANGSGGVDILYGPGAELYNGTGVTSPVCPDGYTLGSGTCNLSDASSVVKPTDGICNVQRVTGSFAFDTNDPDCATASSDLGATQGAASHAGDLTTLGVALDVQLTSAGLVDILASKACSGGICYSYSQFGVPAAGGGSPTLQGLSGGSVAGAADLPTVGGSGGSGGSGGGSTTVNTCGLPGQAACKMDETGTTDSGGAAAKGGNVVTAYGDRTTAANDAASSGSGSAFGIPTFSGVAATVGSGIASPLAGSDDCINPTAVMTGAIAGGGSQTLTLPVCLVIAPIKPILAWALTMLAAFYAWARFTGRVGKGA